MFLNQSRNRPQATEKKEVHYILISSEHKREKKEQDTLNANGQESSLDHHMNSFWRRYLSHRNRKENDRKRYESHRRRRASTEAWRIQQQQEALYVLFAKIIKSPQLSKDLVPNEDWHRYWKKERWKSIRPANDITRHNTQSLIPVLPFSNTYSCFTRSFWK